MDQVTVTTKNSFGSRIKKSFQSVIFWIILIIAMIGLLYWNEWNFLKTAKSLDEVRSQVISVDSNILDIENNWKLVYTQGMLSTNDQLSDEEFGINWKNNIIKLIRNVEMYQREEKSNTTTKDNIWWSQEETTTYTYKKIWSDRLIDSSAFQETNGHINPNNLSINSMSYTIKNAKLGVFDINDWQFKNMNWKEDLAYNDIYMSWLSLKHKESASVQNNQLYIGQWKKFESNNPQIGDIRISWEIVPIDNISIIAEQSWNWFREYQTKVGKVISMVSRGNVSPEQMISDAEKANISMTWILRILGMVLMMIWFSMILSILPTLSSVLPMFGWLVGTGVSLVSFGLWFWLWLLVIAVSWLRYRPITAIIMIIISIATIIAIKIYKKKKINIK